MRHGIPLLRLGGHLRPLIRSYTSTSSTQASRNVIQELESRGFVSALTNPLLKQHVNKPSCIYAGIDPSASSLHVGNLLPLMGLLHFQLAGHQAVALIGGATGSIGDPSGKSTERPSLSPETLETNVQGITTQVHQFFERGGEYAAKKNSKHDVAIQNVQSDGSSGGAGTNTVKVVNNLEWFGGMGFLEFLRTVGKMARVSTMISRDCVKSRLDTEQGISFTEFSYQLLQAYDFSVLYRKHGCHIQLGGNDQWGNIVAGIDLIKRQKTAELKEAEDNENLSPHIEGKWATRKLSNKELNQQNQKLEVARRKAERQKAAAEKEGEVEKREEDEEPEVFGLTMPLLTTDKGEKFGKSAGNAIWLDTTQTSVTDFYQFFIRTSDATVESYLKLFTLLPLDRVSAIMQQHRINPGGRYAQLTLASEITELVHGKAARDRASLITNYLYHTPLQKLSSAEILETLDGERQLIRVKWRDIKQVPITKLLVLFGIAKSRSHATRAVTHRALSISGYTVTDPRFEISRRRDLKDKNLILMQLGKKETYFIYIDFDEPGESDSQADPKPSSKSDSASEIGTDSSILPSST